MIYSFQKKELLLNIKEVETEIEFRIESSFNSISVHFSEIFETLFPGGKDHFPSLIKQIF